MTIDYLGKIPVLSPVDTEQLEKRQFTRLLVDSIFPYGSIFRPVFKPISIFIEGHIVLLDNEPYPMNFDGVLDDTVCYKMEDQLFFFPRALPTELKGVAV